MSSRKLPKWTRVIRNLNYIPYHIDISLPILYYFRFFASIKYVNHVTSSLVEKLLVCMITTGCHVKNRKWKECSDIFMQRHHIYKIHHFYAELWDGVIITSGNLSSMETGDLGVVEVKMKMKQITEEQDAVKMDKDEEKARQLRLSN